MLKHVRAELKEHLPFTLLGGVTGIICLFIFRNLSYGESHALFYVFHPLHVFLSAFATSAFYHRYERGTCSFWKHMGLLLLIGYVGSVGIATLSDSIMPFIGETLLKLPHRHVHVGFVEEWYVVNPMAFAGILAALWKPMTKMPHTAHVLVSTWASLFHMLMAAGNTLTFFIATSIFVFLVISVWIPCCVSDIVFPLLFVGEKPCGCGK